MQVTSPLPQSTWKQTQNKDGVNDGIILAIFKKKDDHRAGPTVMYVNAMPVLGMTGN